MADPSCNGGLATTQVQDDNFFYRYYYSNITYFASAGDSGSEVVFLSASPWVVSVGSTTVNRDVNENFLSESCWPDSGGGFSAVETLQSTPSILNGMDLGLTISTNCSAGLPMFSRSDPPLIFHLTPI